MMSKAAAVDALVLGKLDEAAGSSVPVDTLLANIGDGIKQLIGEENFKAFESVRSVDFRCVLSF